MSTGQYEPKLSLDMIKENPDALRTVDLERPEFIELKAAIDRVGVQQAIIVRPAPDDSGKFIIVDGAHRYTASKQLGRQHIPAVIQNVTEAEAYDIQAITNLHQIKTRPAEYANHLRRILARNLTMNSVELAAKLGKSTTWVSNMLKLTTLKDGIQAMVNEGKMTVTNAQALALLPEDEQEFWLDKALTQEPTTFRSEVDSRVTEIKKLKAQGKDPNASTAWEPTTRLRKLADINDFRNDLGAVNALVSGLEDPVEAALLALAWAVNMDPASIARQKDENEKRTAERKAAQEKAQVERAEKKKTDAEKTIAEYNAKKAASS